MSPEELLDHCLAKPGAWRDNPFDLVWPVVKVTDRGKIFCFVNEHSCGVKSGTTRQIADEWLEAYPEDAAPMRYLGRGGWNELRLAGNIPDDDLLSAVDDSYPLVVGRIPKVHRPKGWEG